MTIAIKEDIVYILLQKVRESEGEQGLNISQTDFAGRQVGTRDLLGHLDFLNQKQYIDADFAGNAYATQADVPSVVNPDEFDLRIANTLGSSDGPLPHLIAFKKADLTEKGRKMLQKMEENPPKALKEGPSIPIVDEHMPFLEKVMLKGNLEDIFDARDATNVVFRVMRDLMTTETSDRVAADLSGTEAAETKDRSLQMDVSELWKDMNPIVGFLSRVRPPWQGPGIFKIEDHDFFFRVAREGGLPPSTNGETVTAAVFSATKEQLSPERIEEVASWLPGKVRTLWEKS